MFNRQKGDVDSASPAFLGSECEGTGGLFFSGRGVAESGGWISGRYLTADTLVAMSRFCTVDLCFKLFEVGSGLFNCYMTRW